MDNLENVSIESEREAKIEKEKVTELDLVFEVMGEKPYYQIKYKKVGDNFYHTGYGSYNFEVVLEYRDKYFELVKEEKSSTKERYIIDKYTIARSILYYGEEKQSTVCMEECAELIQAISKAKRGKINRDNMIEEIADVLICIEMLKQMYMISDEKINKWIEKKQEREAERISDINVCTK
jgi:NTP pyrophosphatase (non-canonical NTP hydrolase)